MFFHLFFSVCWAGHPELVYRTDHPPASQKGQPAESMDDFKLDDIRAEIAACRFIEEGSTQQSRQRANGKIINLYAKLDEYGTKLDELREVASRENKSTSEIEVRL